MRIGVVGYSIGEFDKGLAESLLLEGLEELEALDRKDVIIVSGLTALGVPLIAYEFAVKKGWKTMGVACEAAKEYVCFGCDYTYLVGEKWGDESLAFLTSIDALIRIGGGKQSLSEAKLARSFGTPVIEKEIKREIES